MAEILIAVDPGGTTGHSHTLTDGINPIAGQLPPQEFCRWAEEMTGRYGRELTIICEKFTISQRTLKVSRGGSYDALEVIGVLRYLSKRDCGRDLEMQQPAEVMAMFPDAWLRERGWYIPGQQHANDSLRHLARALAKRKLIRVSHT